MASPSAKPTWANLHTDPALKDRQDKIVKIVHSQMMDFKLYSPDKLESCVKQLIQLFDNILQSPDKDKYRKACVLFAAMHPPVVVAECRSEPACRSGQTMQTSSGMFWTVQSKVRSFCWQLDGTVRFCRKHTQAVSLCQSALQTNISSLSPELAGQQSKLTAGKTNGEILDL